MLMFRLSFFCFLVCVVKNVLSEDVETCDTTDKDMNNVTINTSQYCKNNICIYKCCGQNEILNNPTNKKKKCETAKKFKKYYRNVKYEEIPIAQSLNGTKVTKSNKRLTKDFVFIYNNKFSCAETPYEIQNDNFHIWENGTATFITIGEGFEEKTDLQPEEYCVDYRIIFEFENHKVVGGNLNFVLITLPIEDYQENVASFFTTIGMLISCFFFLVVLFVYGILPSLHTIGGLVLMAYVSSLLVTYLVAAFLSLAIESLPTEVCSKISIVLYFAALTQFFWLNISSIELFLAFRESRKCINNHLKEEKRKVKFTWYFLYAWGVPLLITIVSVILDNLDIRQYGLIPPPFSICFHKGIEVFYYLHIPIIIIISVNTLLFIMTVINIQRIRRGIGASFYRQTKKDMISFKMHMKLGLMMGISWSIEVLQNFISLDVTWTVVADFYHTIIGVVIFFFFVFKKNIFIMLCKKFHIKNEWVRNLQESSYQYSKSGTGVQTSRRYTFQSSRNKGP